jgi:ABC-2 type transport system ATP-binding protein
LASSIEELKATHRRVTLRFADPIDRPPALVGSTSCAGGAREWTYICNGQGPQILRAAEAIGGDVVDDAAMSLDEIFVSRVLT